MPGDYETARRLPRGDGAPLAFVAVRLAADAASAGARLDNRFLQRLLTDVVGSRPPRVESIGEHFERTLEVGVHSNALLHGCRLFTDRRHHFSSSPSETDTFRFYVFQFRRRAAPPRA